MASQEQESAKRKIDALLRKAASSEHKSEREVFEAKAVELMVKWEISERELTGEENPISQHSRDYSEYGNFVLGITNLALNIADMNGGFGFFNDRGRTKGQRKGTKCIFFGTDRVADIVDQLIPHFFRQLQYEFMMSGDTSRQSFSFGWCNRVAERLREQLEQAYSDSMALVPVNTAAKEQAYSEYNLGHSKSVKVGSNSSYNKGQSAANRADLGNSRLQG